MPSSQSCFGIQHPNDSSAWGPPFEVTIGPPIPWEEDAFVEAANVKDWSSIAADYKSVG